MTQRVIVGEGDYFLKRDGLASTPTVWEDGLRAETCCARSLTGARSGVKARVVCASKPC